MIQTGFKASTVINFIKDNLSLLIIVPAFIGGLWQSIELMSISIPYIRFFSISQIVPDGILILIFLILASSTTMLNLLLNKVLYSAPQNEEITVLTEAEKEKQRKKDIRKCCIIFFLCCICGFAYFIGFINLHDSIAGLYTDGIIALAICLQCNLCLRTCYELANSFYKEIYKFFNVILLFFYLLLAFYFCKRIHNTFLLTENLDNIENIECILQEKYPSSKREILYFNDKYIFVKIFNKEIDMKTKKPKEKIHILELENLFNN